MTKNNRAYLSNSVAQRRAAKISAALKKLFPAAGMMLTFSNHWELLVAVELSAQCTDKKVNEVTARLFKKYPTLDAYVVAGKTAAGRAAFERDIFQTGFYRAKTKHIVAAAEIIQKKFHGRMPRTMHEMLTIPGVGRKTANVVLGNAHGIVEGIAVDTHVRRLARVLGLTQHMNPDKIEKDLMQLFPRREWFALTYRLIEYGRRFCPARKHAHTHCPLTKFCHHG